MESSTRQQHRRARNRMSEELNPLNIANICGGVVPDRFDRCVQEIMRNIADVNTPDDVKRELTMTISFEPDPSRQSATALVNFKTKLIGAEPKAALVFMRKLPDGSMAVYADNPAQMNLPLDETTIGKPTLVAAAKSDTGV